MKLLYTSLLSVIMLQSSLAQQGSVGMPVLGFAFDSKGGVIRSLRGIPGAAILGDAIDIGFAATSAAIAPQQSFALVLSADGLPRVVSLDKSSVLRLDNAMAAPDRMVFSPSGATAVLLSTRDTLRIQIVTGLPGTPAVQDIATDALASFGGSVAVSDDGRLLMLAESSQNRTWLFHSGGNQTMLPIPGSGVVLAFQRDSHDAAAITDTGDIYQLQNLDTAAMVRTVMPGGTQTADAVGLWISPDGGHAYTASSGGSLTAVDLTTGAAQSVSCQCVPTGMQPLRASMFRVTDVSSKPVMVFDVSSITPRVWFVPVRSLPELVGGAQ